MAATAKKPKHADPLLAAVIADPDDDTVRLAFADWLDEHDEEPRAEFIRVQVELARLPAWDRKAKLLRYRERSLLIQYGETWREQLPRIAGIAWGKFERGFVSDVTAENPEVFAKKADAIRAVAPITGARLLSLDRLTSRSVREYPWLGSLRLAAVATPADSLAAVLASPLSRHLRRFAAGGVWLTGTEARRFVENERLGVLRELDLSNCGIDDGIVTALAGCKHLAGLRVLRMRLSDGSGYVPDPHISAAGLRTLAASPHLTNLTTLDVGNQRFSDGAVRAVLSSPTLAKLETVSFAGSVLTDKAFQVPAGPLRLRDVDLSQCTIGDAGLAALAKLPQFSEVERLNLRACEVGAKGLASLTRSPLAKSVQKLNLSDNPVRSAGMDELARGRWPQLYTLNLSASGLGSESMKTFQAATGFGSLLDLDLSHNEVGAAAAIAAARAKWSGQLVRLNLAHSRCAAGAVLANATNLRQLQQLDLTDNALTPAGVEALLEGEWPELTELRLGNTGAGDDGAKALAASGVLSRLVVLSLNRCGLTADGVAALFGGRTKNPASRLVQLDLSGNPSGDETTQILLRGALTELRFLAIDNLGLGAAALQRLLDTPFLARLVRLHSNANEFNSSVAQALFDVNRRPIPPDLEAAGLPLRFH